MHTTLRTGLRVLTVAGLALLLSGCIKAHQILTLNPDDTIDGSFIVGVSKELVDLTGQDPNALLEQMTATDSPLPEGVDFETSDFDDGDYVGKEFSFSGVSLEAFNANGEITVDRDGDDFVVEGAADMTDPGEGVDLNDPTTQQLMESIDVKVQITFPGPVSESNGEVEGNTVTWTPALGEANEIHAVGSAIASGGGSLLWIILAASIVVIGLIVFFVRKSSMSGGPTEAEIAEGTPEPPMAPEAPAAALEAPAAPMAPEAPAAAPEPPADVPSPTAPEAAPAPDAPEGPVGTDTAD